MRGAASHRRHVDEFPSGAFHIVNEVEDASSPSSVGSNRTRPRRRRRARCRAIPGSFRIEVINVAADDERLLLRPTPTNCAPTSARKQNQSTPREVESHASWRPACPGPDRLLLEHHVRRHTSDDDQINVFRGMPLDSSRILAAAVARSEDPTPDPPQWALPNAVRFPNPTRR